MFSKINLFAFLLAVTLVVVTTATFAAQPQTPIVSAFRDFSHDNTVDISGYYLPKQKIKIGKFQLHNLSVGDLHELKSWESGKNRSTTYAPVMFIFEDLSSKRIQTEIGEAYSNQPRVLPSTYSIKGNTITFSGMNKQVGRVTFKGTLDIKKLSMIQTNNTLDADQIILRGNLTIAGKRFKDFTFSWWEGD
ncbi:MAG: hypothetical protein K2X50_00845 [Gammaproteobacteria bacterium]|nr:hypothetical protein [Gammaproteobacteria bacterium]